MPHIKKFLLLSIIFLGIYLYALPTFAQDVPVSINVSPTEINYNTNPVTVTINDIPTSNEGTNFAVKIYKNGISGTEVSSIDITSGITGCVPNNAGKGAGWKGDTACTTSNESSSSYTFTGELDTAQLQFNPESVDGENGVLYDVWVTGGRIGSTGIHASFYISPTKNAAPFTIDRIDGDQGKDTGLVKPGEDILIFLQGATNDHQYEFGVEGIGGFELPTGVNCRPGEPADKPSGSCTLLAPIPDQVRDTITLLVRDATTKLVAKRIVRVVTDVDPRPSAAILSITPLPTPIPATSTPAQPPEPPCADEYITRVKNNNTVGNLTPTPVDIFVGCGELYTGLGFNLSTEPAAFIADLFRFLLSISGMLLIGVIIYSGYQFMVSQGDAEKIKVARERITSAIIGFVFMVFSLVILEVIGVDILRIPGFCRDGDISCSSVTNRDSSYDNIENSRLDMPEIVIPTSKPVPTSARPLVQPPSRAPILGPDSRFVTLNPTPSRTPTPKTPIPTTAPPPLQPASRAPQPALDPRFITPTITPVVACRQTGPCKSNADCTRFGCMNYECVIPPGYPADALCKPK